MNGTTSTTLCELPFVFFDLETTGLYNSDPDILQIGGVTSDCIDSFDTYLEPPTKVPNASATKANHLCYDSMEKRLYRLVKRPEQVTEDKVRCYTTEAKQGLQQFIDWLRNVGCGKKVVLVAYNGFAFDGRILLKKLVDFQLMENFRLVCQGFADPLIAARLHYAKLPSRRMECMLKYFGLLDEQDQTHNAILDAEDLRKLTLAMAKDVMRKKQEVGDSVPTWKVFMSNHFKNVQEIADMIVGKN